MPGTRSGPDLIISADPSWPALGDDFGLICQKAGFGFQVMLGNAEQLAAANKFHSHLQESTRWPGFPIIQDPFFLGVEGVATRPVALACRAGGIRWIGLDAGPWLNLSAFHAEDRVAEDLALGVVKSGLYEAMDEVEFVYLSNLSEFASTGFPFQSRGDCLRAVAAYGRSLELALSVAGWSAPMAAGESLQLEFSCESSRVETTVEEHAFVAFELRRRGVRLGAFAPATDWQRIEDREIEALQLLEGHLAVCKAFGHRFLLRQGIREDAETASILERTQCQAILRTTGIGMADALALLGRRDPDLFRKCVECLRSLIESTGSSDHRLVSEDLWHPRLRPWLEALLVLARCGAGPFQVGQDVGRLDEVLTMAGKNSEGIARKRFRSLINRLGRESDSGDGCPSI